MYTSYTIWYFYIIYIFELDSKCMITSFFLIKTHFVNLLQIILINFIVSALMCIILYTEFFILLQDDNINCMWDDSIVLFLYSKTFHGFSILPVVFSRPAFSVLSTKVSQDLIFSDEYQRQ